RRAGGSAGRSPTVLWMAADAVARLHWRSDFSSLSPRTIADRLAPASEPRLAGVALPAGTTRLSIATRLRGTGVVVGLTVADDRGRTQLLSFGEVQQGSGLLFVRLPR